ncbi:unnamed protein product [Ambrosiozyma monospora]|uniref:Unnamed protein product n=1 Tax=Ambrosiozyma monospora TaxID=43982 RepID=A0ACB5U228_AMBMO|nr:unnamed protein product [Ambrosiozyma monospora]
MKNKPDTELNKDSIIDCFMVPDKLNHLSLRDRGHVYNISFEFYPLETISNNWSNNELKVHLNTYRSNFGNFTTGVEFDFTRFDFTNLKSISITAHAPATIKLIDVPSTLLNFNVPQNTRLEVPEQSSNLSKCGLLNFSQVCVPGSN